MLLFVFANEDLNFDLNFTSYIVTIHRKTKHNQYTKLCMSAHLCAIMANCESTLFQEEDNERKMSVIREFRIPMPLTVEEYRIAQLYSVARASKNETGGGEGIEIVANEPFSGNPNRGGQGQYTKKIIHLASKVPSFIRLLSPNGSLEIHENAWNAYPYCMTEYSNPYMKDSFILDIKSFFKPDRVALTDVSNKYFEISDEELSKRTVDYIDIVNDKIDPRDYRPEEDPSNFMSQKTGRGRLNGPDWYLNCDKFMCCYKLYKLEFKWFGLQPKVEAIIMRSVRRLLHNFHRQMFCWMDQWYDLAIDDIRKIEKETKDELDESRSIGIPRGMKEV